jgi:hypothetical protein
MKICTCGNGLAEGADECARCVEASTPPAGEVVNFQGKKYDDVLGEPSPEQFDPGAHRGAGYGHSGSTRTDEVPPGSELQGARRVLHLALRELVERVVDGKHVQDWRREVIPVVHVDFGLPGCLVWHRPDGVVDGMPWDRIAEWRSTRIPDERPYPPMPSATG